MVCRQQSGCVDFFQQTFHTGTANRASQVGVDFSVNSNQCWYTRFPGGSFSVVLAFYIVLRHAFQCSNGNSFLHSMLKFPSLPCNRFYLILKCSPWRFKQQICTFVEYTHAFVLHQITDKAGNKSLLLLLCMPLLDARF